MNDLISRQDAIDTIRKLSNAGIYWFVSVEAVVNALLKLPSTQPNTHEGCKHLGKWENEVEYGYSSPCTRCKRRAHGCHYQNHIKRKRKNEEIDTCCHTYRRNSYGM